MDSNETSEIIFAPDEARKYPYIAAVEHLLGGLGRSVYPDGTQQFCDDDVPEKVYSPRLPVGELNEFCAKHLERYEAFNDEHCELIEDGEEVPEIEPFWEDEDNQ